MPDGNRTADDGTEPVLMSIGWVIGYKLPKHGPYGLYRMPNIKVYQSEAVAARYAHGQPLKEVFIKM